MKYTYIVILILCLIGCRLEEKLSNLIDKIDAPQVTSQENTPDPSETKGDEEVSNGTGTEVEQNDIIGDNQSI